MPGFFILCAQSWHFFPSHASVFSGIFSGIKQTPELPKDSLMA